jgi:predicted transcriptional regulator
MSRDTTVIRVTIDAMTKAQRASLTAQVGLEEYAHLRARGIQPKIMYSTALGYRVRDPYASHRPSNTDSAEVPPR